MLQIKFNVYFYALIISIVMASLKIGPLSVSVLFIMFDLLFSLGSDDGSSDLKHVVCFR
jgi:hypothetical protein